MKKSLLASLVALSVISTAASASVGTITINGELTASTCDVSVNGGGVDATVTLPTLPAKTLAAAGVTAGDTAFTMELSNCEPKSGDVIAYFEHGATVDAASGRLNNVNATGAKNVQVELLDSSSAPVYVGNTAQRTATPTALNNGAANLVYQARYYATGVSTSGELNTSVTYSIDYQ
ncbi:Type 1 fimbrial protein [Paramixta manurensis]|uniref:Type 1 fimbrial protein n=2 Tax=Paramixta manurensis TaxID=2740817 RepID=A0A6M8UHZ2_9GAMM|nr:Type 1 fimbrial protein [Erwiniaceae bacterium PD-1]